MLIKDIIIDQDNTAKGYEIDLPKAKLIVVVARKGYLMCGYLNIEAAERFNDCAAIVKGVNSIDELLSKQVYLVSKTALNAN